MIGGREPGHVQAGLGDDRHGELGADAGDLREPLRRGQHRGARAGTGDGTPSGADAPGGGDGVQGGLDLVLDRGVSRSRRVMWSRWTRISMGW